MAGKDAITALIARMDEQRTRWVPLPDGKRVQVRRPLQTELRLFVGGGVSIEHVCQYVCGWDGFTEADLLGAAVGSSDPLPFAAELWDRVVRDRIDYVQPVAEAMASAIGDYLQTIGSAEKN